MRLSYSIVTEPILYNSAAGGVVTISLLVSAHCHFIAHDHNTIIKIGMFYWCPPIVLSLQVGGGGGGGGCATVSNSVSPITRHALIITTSGENILRCFEFESKRCVICAWSRNGTPEISRRL